MAETDERPLIAVTGPDAAVALAWRFTHFNVWLAGGLAVRLTPAQPAPPQRFDAIVVGGGSDIDPALYSGLDDGRVRLDRARDAFEMRMLDAAMEAGIPILGICRGAQLLNVVLGGNLHQDLRRLRTRTSNRRTPLPRKTVHIEAGSSLAAILQTDRCRVNSLHHQAVNRTGDGLRVVARDLDGIAQAIEDPRQRFRLGLQWHPEYLPYQARQRRVFRHLVAAARLTRIAAPA